MLSSTFDPAQIEKARQVWAVSAHYDRKLIPQPFRRYSIRAAANLHATARDLARFAIAFCRPNPVLRKQTLAQMMQPQPGTAGSWGLGLTLFVAHGSGYVVGHDGGSSPATGAVLRINPATGNAVVVTVSGGRVPISRLRNDWMFWERARSVTAPRERSCTGGCGSLPGCS